MNAFLFFFILLGGLAIAVYLTITLIQRLSRAKTIFTTVEAGDTTFIVAGDSIKAIWPNIDEHRLSSDKDPEGRYWLVLDKTEASRTKRFFGPLHESSGKPTLITEKLWQWFGIRYVSIFPNQVKVHKFEISKKKLVEEGDLPDGHTLKDRVKQSKSSPWVSSLRFIAERPIYLHELELGGDNASLNIVVLAVYQQVIPTLPVFNYKGGFFQLLDAAVQASVVDFLAKEVPQKVIDANAGNDTLKGNGETTPLTYYEWLRLDKGNGSLLEKHLYRLNASKEYMNRIKTHSDELFKQLEALVPDPVSKDVLEEGLEHGDYQGDDMSHGIIPRFGWALRSIRVIDWDATKETEELAIAIREKETQFHTAQGVIEQKTGEAKGIDLVSDAESRRYSRLLKAQRAEGVDANIAAANLGQQVRTENIAKAGLGTYVEGGSSASVMVPANAKQDESKKSKESS